MAGDLSPDRQQEARDLARSSRRLDMIESALEALLLLVFLSSGASALLRDLLPGGIFLKAGLFVPVLAAGYGLLFGPLEYLRSCVLPRRYGLDVPAFPQWLAARVKVTALAAALGLVIFPLVYWLLAGYPRTWWLRAGLAIVLASVLLTNLAPVVVLPIFVKLRPLTEPALVLRLQALMERADVRFKDVYLVELRRANISSNAALMGLGPTRRVVLSDSLVRRYSVEEVEAVVAHELGHQRHGDVPRLILFRTGLVFVALYCADLALRHLSAAFGLAGPADVAGLPLLLLVVTGVPTLTSPLVKAVTRAMELSADSYALRLAREPGAFATALGRLTDENLDPACPPRWEEWLFYDHPPYCKRRARVEEYMRKVDSSQ